MLATRFPRRYLVIAASLTLFCILLLGRPSRLLDGTPSTGAGKWTPWGTAAPQCSEDLSWLEQYNLSSPIQYAQRDILAVPPQKPGRPSVTVVNKPLFDGFVNVDLGMAKKVDLQMCNKPLVLEVPRIRPAPASASHMIFGLQTTLDRLKDTRKHLARWLPSTGARLFAIVVEQEGIPADDHEMQALQKLFRDQGMDVTIMHPVNPTDSFPQRYFSLASVMYQARNQQTEWVVLIDDDTFFPSMQNLVEMLSSYNTSKQHYLGSLSEDWPSVNLYGLMAFGGAGIFLSLPLAEVIDRHTPECKRAPRSSAGDITVMDCIYKYTSTKLTHIPSLHQIDMLGDLSGFYESGRESLSLHHWKGGFKLEMDKLHAVADVCGSCFLQRWQFQDEILLTNGFSIAQYPLGNLTGTAPPSGFLGTGIGSKSERPDPINLENMEQTWTHPSKDGNFMHSLAPFREPLNERYKHSYRLLDSLILDSNFAAGKRGDVVRQVYLKKATEGLEDVEGKDKELDAVIVLDWKAVEGDVQHPLDGENSPLQTSNRRKRNSLPGR